jgi:hypothetical protein
VLAISIRKKKKLTWDAAYLYNPGIMGIMPVAGGYLSRKRTS